VIVAIGIEPLVPAMEALEKGLVERPGLPVGDVDLVGLAEIAAVERALQDDVLEGEAVLEHVAAALLFQGPIFPFEPGQRDLGVRLHERLGVVLDRVGHQEAESREDAGVSRHQDRGQANMGGHLDGMHAARPAEGEEGESARIDAAFDRDDADGFLHVGVGDGHDAEGRFGHGLADGAAQLRDRGQAPLRMDRHPPAQEEAGVEAAEAEVGVRNGRQVAPAVASRARIGAGALGADPERAAPVGIGDRAAAGPDRMDIDDGQADGEVADAALVGPPDAAFDQGDVRRGAAHVEADDIGEAGRGGQHAGPDDPSGRPGQRRPDGLDTGPGRGDVALVRLHDAQVGAADAAVELAEIAVHDRHEVGVDGRGRRPLELAVLGQKPAGDGEQQAGPFELPGHGLLVRGIGIRMEEADGDGLRPGPLDLLDDLADLSQPDGFLDLARGQRPLMKPEPPLGRDELEAALWLERVKVPAGLAADGQDVLESGRRDESDAAALALEQRVGGHGRAVDNEDGGGVLQDVADALENGLRRVFRRREDLAVEELTVPPDDEVGERPAGIHPDPDRGWLLVFLHGRRGIRQSTPDSSQAGLRIVGPVVSEPWQE
jgi:hypothetical protein